MVKNLLKNILLKGSSLTLFLAILIVLAGCNFSFLNSDEDTTAPVIRLEGSVSIEVELLSDFLDPGATASDDVDGDISADIVVTGTVDTSSAGSYTLQYNVSDSSGNPAATVSRTVICVEDINPNLLFDFRTVNPLGLANAYDGSYLNGWEGTTSLAVGGDGEIIATVVTVLDWAEYGGGFSVIESETDLSGVDYIYFEFTADSTITDPSAYQFHCQPVIIAQISDISYEGAIGDATSTLLMFRLCLLQPLLWHCCSRLVWLRMIPLLFQRLHI